MVERITLDDAIKKYGDFYLISGMGNDSVKMIAQCYKRGLEPKAVIFCDTGNEMPHTYKFLCDLSLWMMSKDWSKLVIIKNKNAKGEVINVYDENFKNGRLPPPVYGFKTCSLRFKMEPVNKWLKNNYECVWQWGKTKSNFIKGSWSGKVVKAVGINADEDSRISGWIEDDKFEQCFPLVDWDIGEGEGVKDVFDIGLYMPGKSACFMCPNSTAEEVVNMYKNYPWLYEKAIAMEDNVIEAGNDVIEVDRVFVYDPVSGTETKLPPSRVKKKDKKIDLNLTLSSLTKKELSGFGFSMDEAQMTMFENPSPELVVKKVTEQTNFVGLGRNVSWRDVVKYYQSCGQVEAFDSMGAVMCGGAGCGT